MTPAALLVSHSKILNEYLQRQFPTAKQVYLLTQLELRTQLTGLPDYSISSRMESAGLDSGASYDKLFLLAMQHLAKPLYVRGSTLYVKQERFADWQDMLTYVMPLPVIAFFAASHFKSQHDAVAFFMQSFQQFSCLPGPYIPELEQLFRQGVCEHHMHIMGTTESDFVWIDALRYPKAWLKNLRKAEGNANAKQQLAQLNDRLEFKDINHLLNMATGLRHLLLLQIQGASVGDGDRYSLSKLLNEWPASYQSIELRRVGINTNNPLVHEAMLLYTHYQHIDRKKCEESARTVHLYLLIQAMLHRLLNQQLVNKGFQQFEKITQNELRETAETRFRQRFKQVHSMYNHPISLLEARFAPKNDARALRSLLYSLQEGYVKSKKTAPLSLTAHFIKQPDRAPNPLYMCRHYVLRKRLAVQSQVFLRYVKHVEKAEAEDALFSKGGESYADRQRMPMITSIDSAGNELHAGPEVFAPLYRQLRESGFCHFTYHAGEDFKHLLCGMRQVYEAMHFLDLREGDRIGHATAIGIEPKLWLDRAAAEHKIAKGEWLDDLLFAHHLLLQRRDAVAASIAYQLAADINQLAAEIFKDRQVPCIETLKMVWRNRWRDPLCKYGYMDLPDTVQNVLRAWHHNDVYGEALKTVQVKSDYLSAEVYRELQNDILKELSLKNIALETLPSSNIRISYYKNYVEHHVHRWLADDAPPTPAVVVGSDDPGIFATNIFNEYAHIYLSAKANSLDNGKAIILIERLLRSSKEYGFKPSA